MTKDRRWTERKSARDKYRNGHKCAQDFPRATGEAPSPKVQVAPLRSRPPAPYLADHSPRQGASAPAPAPRLRQASLLPRRDKALQNPRCGCGEDGAPAALA